MKIKTLLLTFLIGFGLALTSHFIAIAAIDAPHNESNNISCGKCHGQGLLQSPFWGGSMSYDELCQYCHTQSSCPLPELVGPVVSLHKDSGDTALAECRTCHDPHYQKQKNYKSTDADNLYLATGTITGCVDNGDGTSTLTYSSIMYKDGLENSEQDWDATKLIGKTDTCRRTILFPNVKKLGYSYPVIGIDEGANTITVRGNATPVYQYITESTFAVMYGQYIRDSINDMPVKFFDQTGANSFGDGEPPFDGVCEVCHTNTTHFRNDGSGDDPKHLNVSEGGAGGTNCITCHSHTDKFLHGGGASGGTSCVDCHGTTGSHPAHVDTIDCNVCHADNPPNVSPADGYSFTYDPVERSCSSIRSDDLGSCHFETDATWDESACTGCHSSTHDVGARVNVMDQFNNGNSHHIQGTTIEGAHCYECHWEADGEGLLTDYHESSVSGSPVDMVIYGDGTRPTTYDFSSAIRYTPDGSRNEIKKLNNHCISCHRDENNTTAPFVNDSKTPNEYAWDETSISARYSSNGTTTWGKNTDIVRGTGKDQTKAFFAHGNALNNEGGWDTAENWPNRRDGLEKVACFDCHNSHGSGVSGVTTSYTSATANGGILKDTQEDKGGYNVTYKPAAGGSATDKNPYNAGAGLCFDCHMNPNQSAFPSWPSGTPVRPWGYEVTFGASQQIRSYLDTPYFGPSGYNSYSGPQQRYTFKQGASHKGGHFKKSSPLNSDVAEPIDGLCTPCHDPHGVSPTLDQAYAVPLLKGTWMTSLYREDAAPDEGQFVSNPGPVGRGVQTIWTADDPGYYIDQNTFKNWKYYDTDSITESADKFGGLCLRCHSKNAIDPDILNSWKSMDRIHDTVKEWGANNKHAFSCSKCHAPHSSRLPKLMITNCLDFRHYGKVASGGEGVERSGSGSGNRGHGSGYGQYPSGGAGGRSNTISIIIGFGRDKKCHEDINPVGFPDQERWNTVTEWASPTVGPVTAEGSNIQTTIFWTVGPQSTSCVDYGLSVSYDTTVCNDALVTNHTVLLTGLENHKTYYFRVRSETEDGGELYSAISSFITAVPPSNPTLIDEPDNICDAACDVTLEWNPAVDPDGGTLEYKVQVDNNSSFNSPEYTSGWISNTSVTEVVTPNSDTTWYWHVKARHSGAESEYSYRDSFRVVTNADYPNLIPTIPFLIDEPDIICTGFTCTVTLEWNPSSNPSGNGLEYQVWVAADGNWSDVYYNSGWISGTSASTWFGKSMTDWHWKVRARDAVTYATSPWSDVDIFMVRPQGPLITAGPQTGSITVVGGVIRATISWTTDEFTTSYVDYGPAYSYGTTAGNDSLVTDHQVILTGLQNHQTYSYKVRSANAGGDSVTSGAYLIDISVSPTRPVAIAEPDTQCPASCDVTLEWNESTNPGNGGPLEYQVQVNDDRDLGWGSPEYDSGWISGTSSVVTLRPDESAIWYWRVRARDAAATSSVSDWSLLDGFNIAPALNSAPLPPLLIDEPDFDGGGTSTSVTLEWTPETDPDGHPVEYYVEADNAPDFSSPEYMSGWISETNFRITVGFCTEWWWRVKARDAVDTGQESAWSETDDFSDDLSAACVAHFTPSIPILIDEPDNVCDAPCDVTVEWNASTGAGFGPYEYKVQIDNNKGFGSIEYDSDWIQGTNWTVTISPNPDNTWWWRVKVRDSNHPDAISNWSFKDSFRVVTNADYPNLPPTCPNIVPEPDNICASACDVTLEWEASTNPSGEAIQYKVQVDDVSNFSSIDYDSTWQLEDVYCVVDQCGWTFNLPTNKTWYWRIRARDAVDTEKYSVWSDDDSFEVRPPSKVPTVPVLMAEEDTVCLTATCDVTLEWNASTIESGDPVQYKLQADDDSDFSSPVYDTGWDTSTNRTGPLTTGATYYWRVMARNQNYTTEQSGWSDTDIFAMFSSNPPPEPLLIQELDISEPVPVLVTLEWDPVIDPDGDPVEYSVEVDDASDFSSPDYNTTGWISATSWDVTIDTATTWYWRVKARDAVHTDAESSWSNSDSFIIYEPPQAPTLIAEPDIDSAMPVLITFEWNAVTAPDGDPVEYYVQVDDDPGFGSPDYTSPWVTDTYWEGTISGTTTWYWRVRARDAGHIALLGPWSTANSFDIFSAPPAPELVEEPDHYGVTPVPVTLEWNAVTAPDGDPVEYYVQVSDSSIFLSPIESGWISVLSWDVDLETDKTWYWRVIARDAVHTESEATAEWSTDDSFILTTPPPPPAPELIDETDVHVITVPTDITLEWNTVTAPDGDPVEYSVQYSQTPGFTFPSYVSGWISGTSWTGSLNTGTWYWRVKARDSVHTFAESSYSTSDTFIITIELPPAPELIDEPDVVSAVPVSVTLEWNSVTCPDGHDAQYYVEVDDASDFSSINYNSTWSLATSWSVTVDPDKTWYWRVKARDSYITHWSVVSEWSTVDSFSVMPHNPPGKPTIQAEPDIVTTGNTLITLQWWAVTSPDGDPVEYYVEVDTIDDFSSPTASGWISGNCVSNVCTWDVTLPPGYWCWRVKARDTIHTAAVSLWSNTDIFYTMAPPSTPTIIAEPDIVSDSPVTVTLEWLPSTSQTGNPVEYQVNVNNLLQSPYQSYTSDWISDTHWSITLDPNFNWYWNVKARDAVYPIAVSGTTANDIFSIVTSNAPPVPALIDEPDVITVSVPVDVTLEWEDVDDPEGDPVEYQVWVSESTLFSPRTESGWMTEAAASCDGSTCSWTVSITTANTWYWRVQARDANHTTKISAWAAYDTFRVMTSNPPPAPALIAEPDIVSTVAVDVTLEWNQVTDPDGDPVEYYVEISSFSSFWAWQTTSSGWISGDCSGGVCSWTTNVNPVTYKTWYWRVKARDADHTDAESALSTVDSFAFISSNPPPAPALTDEPDIPTAVPVDVTLEWEDVDDPDGDPVEYDVQVSEYETFGIVVHDSGWMTEAAASCDGSTCSWTAVNVNPAKRWYWRVRARDADHTDALSVSSTDSFSTFSSSPPPAPALVDEPNITAALPVDITLAWEDVDDPEGDPVDYYVQIDDFSNFLTPNYESGWITEGEASCDGSICSWTVTISVEKTWYWRVRARDADHTDAESAYSAFDNFIISGVSGGPETPSAPTLLNEPDDVSSVAKDVIVEWIPVSAPDGDPVEYYVEVDDSSDFSTPASSGWISETSNCISYKCGWTATALDPDITWYWRVQARDAVHTDKISSWSGVDSFFIHLPIINESFEKNIISDGTGYDESWTETIDVGCTLDPDSAVPGTTPPADAGSECLQSISLDTGYTAYARLNYGSEEPKSFTRFYLYVEAEGLADGNNKLIGIFEDASNNDVFRLRLNQSAGQLEFNIRVYNNGAYEDYYASISLDTWYRIDIKYDDSGNTWEWKLDGVVKDSGNLTGTHYTGIQKWILGFMSTSQPYAGTAYYDLFTVNTITYY